MPTLPCASYWRRTAGRFVFWMGAVLTAVTTGCVDLRPPVPQTAYRATIMIGTSPVLKEESAAPLAFLEFYQEGKWRRESDAEGQTAVLIDRSDLHVTWALDPKAKSFEERRISTLDEQTPWLLNPFGPRAKADFKLIETEDLAGIAARKYEVSGNRIEGIAWFSPDGVPLRFRGTIQTQSAPSEFEIEIEIEIEYKEIERGQQPAWLFAIPPNFAGYENRKKPADPTSNVNSESIRRARESLERDQLRGSGPSF